MTSFHISPSQLKAKLQVALALLVGLLLPFYLWVAPANATGVYDFPIKPATGDWVIDEADILSRLTEGNVSGSLGDVAKQTGNEVRFVTIHRLDYGETIESFTNQLFEKWFPTPEEQANQVLMVLDNVTNTSAIQTGAAVKESLPDDIAESIAQETLLAPLRKGNKYNQAFSDAGDRLVAVLSGQPDPGPPVIVANVQTEGTFATPEETKQSNATVWVIGLLVAATVIPMATYYLYQILQS
ncbi:TPM domain-containing protein [Oscillatoria sp. FACHB-1407]|uniref:photosystem II repair protein Psb32 n=1 Tax=Oscillatoria sp. FACHB-1407 TaxID=2692847 RepID=UPI001688370E|nr:TPM domain-containing protein [Oscillatoria sp. FACHB-1407]MBD2461753.1 TPM domain-containing protein [Oscillatoria sp. FACHB-1407]